MVVLMNKLKYNISFGIGCIVGVAGIIIDNIIPVAIGFVIVLASTILDGVYSKKE